MSPVAIAVLQDAVVPFDRWLATELSRALARPVPRGLARKAIVAGLVAVAGRIVRDPARMLRRGPSVFVRTFDWLPREAAKAEALQVLFEDDWLIAVDKPAGLVTHETKDANRPSLTQLVERHVGHRVFVHHRLDAGTSGVVVFAKAAVANASLARSFAGREVEKIYTALVQRPPVEWPQSLTVDSPIEVRDNGTVRVDSSGVASTTLIRVLDRRPGHLLIAARPITGRKHQIRVHLASIGAPIVGDIRYGGPAAKGGRLMLHAERLELNHPITAERLVVSSPRPEEFDSGGRRESDPNRLSSRSGRSHPPGSDQRSGEPTPRPPRAGERKKPSRTHTGTARRRPARAGARGSRR